MPSQQLCAPDSAWPILIHSLVSLFSSKEFFDLCFDVLFSDYCQIKNVCMIKNVFFLKSFIKIMVYSCLFVIMYPSCAT